MADAATPLEAPGPGGGPFRTTPTYVSPAQFVGSGKPPSALKSWRSLRSCRRRRDECTFSLIAGMSRTASDSFLTPVLWPKASMPIFGVLYPGTVSNWPESHGSRRTSPWTRLSAGGTPLMIGGSMREPMLPPPEELPCTSTTPALWSSFSTVWRGWCYGRPISSVCTFVIGPSLSLSGPCFRASISATDPKGLPTSRGPSVPTFTGMPVMRSPPTPKGMPVFIVDAPPAPRDRAASSSGDGPVPPSRCTHSDSPNSIVLFGRGGGYVRDAPVRGGTFVSGDVTPSGWGRDSGQIAHMIGTTELTDLQGGGHKRPNIRASAPPLAPVAGSLLRWFRPKAPRLRPDQPLALPDLPPAAGQLLGSPEGQVYPGPQDRGSPGARCEPGSPPPPALPAWVPAPPALPPIPSAG